MDDFRRLLGKVPLLPFGDKPPMVAVLRLDGVIGRVGGFGRGMTIAGMATNIERAFKMRNLAAVALAVNSPGGSPMQSALIAKRIRDLADEKDIPVIAFAEDVAASGGYWLAAAADEIYAGETSIIGSIGVISAGFGLQGLIEKLGVERRLHTAGERKSMLDPFGPEKPADLKHLKSIHKDMHESFKAIVRESRGERLKAPEKELFSGAFWTGVTAFEMGLIDGIGDLRAMMRGRFGEDVRFRTIDDRRPWWRRRFGVERGSTPASGWSGDLIAAVEERLIWSRFGL